MNKLLLKDLEELKSRDLLKLVNKCPFWVCKEIEYEKKMIYKSILIVGITPDSFVYGSEGSYYDDDCDWGSPIRYYDEIKFLPFNEVNDSYVLANSPTPKQKEWLEKHDYNPEEYCGYHAWHIIAEAVEEAKRRHEEYKRRKEIDYSSWDDYDDWEDYDIPNM